MVGSEQLDRVAEAHPTRLHDPIDGRTADVADSQTVPQIGLRRDDQAGRVVLIKRTPPDQFRPPLQFDAEAGHQALDGDFFLEPLDLFVRNPRHQIPS
jgi:hypothetical protein